MKIALLTGDGVGPEVIAELEETCRDGPRTRDVGGTASTVEVENAIAARVGRGS